MSRSRPARTVEFAPDYAAAATNPRAAQGWYARGKEAGRYLAALDVELTAERDGIAARLVRAAALEAEAAVLLAARRPDRAMSAERMGVVSPGDPHRAVDLIARALLLLDEADGRLFVDPRDDPDGLVTGVDLAGVQRRLAGIRASQQRELAQVQAFARRHGAEALFDDTCETHSAWFRDAVARWRDAPVMQRYLADRERQVTAERARDAGARQVQQHRRADRQRMLEEAADLRSLADIPFLGDLAGNDSRGVTPSRAERAVQPAPVQPAAPRQPALVWSDVERRHRELLIWRQERERQRVRQAVIQALADRVGTPQAPTPYAARLLAKLRDGFDPAGLPDKVGATGRTLDQRDAAEIALLSRDPGFRAQMEAARQRAPLPSPMPVTTGPDFLGRVGLVRGRLHFGPVPPDHPGPLRTPLEWAE